MVLLLIVGILLVKVAVEFDPGLDLRTGGSWKKSPVNMTCRPPIGLLLARQPIWI
jgi:hypothetical protein